MQKDSDPQEYLNELDEKEKVLDNHIYIMCRDLHFSYSDVMNMPTKRRLRILELHKEAIEQATTKASTQSDTPKGGKGKRTRTASTEEMMKIASQTQP